LIEQGRFKGAIESIFAHIRQANKYFDERKPWLQIKADRQECGATLYVCVQIIANLSNLLSPFLPFSCGKIRAFLQLGEPAWNYIEVAPGQAIHSLELLFQRIDVDVIQKEVDKLLKRS